jgi:uncharacterized protein DUF4136
MKNRKYLTLIILTLGTLLVGCYPQGPEYTEDLDLVLTNFQSGYDFASKSTYARPNQIVKVTGNLVEGDDPEFIPDATAALILAQIDKNMEDLGWDKVDIDDDPDVLLVPASMETTTIFYYYDYWYWWYGGYYPGWGYPVYGGSYTTGTLLMSMVDPEVIGANGNIIVQWTGALNGILTGAYNANRVNKGIDQAFTQSPYLKTN